MIFKKLFFALSASALLATTTINSLPTPTEQIIHQVRVLKEEIPTTDDNVPVDENGDPIDKGIQDDLTALLDLLKDSDGDGTPDILQKDKAQETLDKIFGVGAGAIIVVVFDVIFMVIKWLQDKGLKRNVKDLSKQAVDMVNSYFDENKDIRDKLTNFENANQAKVENILTELNSTMTAISDIIAKYSGIEIKFGSIENILKTILQNENLLASSNDENIANGVAGKIAESVRLALPKEE